MQGLMLKLLNVDAAGERALRVVAYFDELLAHRPDLESVARSTAILADCVAGLQLLEATRALCFTPNGDAAVPGPAASMTSTLELAGESGERRAVVWLQRDGSRGELDDFILERMALAVDAVLDRGRGTRSVDAAGGFADPALAALLVNERASEIDRARAARLMGLTPHGRLQTVAIQSDGDASDYDGLRAALDQGAGRPLSVVQLTGDLVLGVLPIDGATPAWTDPNRPERIALGPITEIEDAPASWRAARETLRFAAIGSSWPRFLHHDQVGPLALLLGLDRESVLADEAVRAIERLASSANGTEQVDALDRLVHADSLRSAARDSNFHHSSLQARARRLEQALGIDLRHGIERQRTAHALLLWQLFH